MKRHQVHTGPNFVHSLTPSNQPLCKVASNGMPHEHEGLVAAYPVKECAFVLKLTFKRAWIGTTGISDLVRR